MSLDILKRCDIPATKLSMPRNIETEQINEPKLKVIFANKGNSGVILRLEVNGSHNNHITKYILEYKK